MQSEPGGPSTPNMGAGGAGNSRMKGSGNQSSKDMIFRADMIDLKSLDAELERHLTRVLSRNAEKNRRKEEWEIDLAKLEIRYVVANGAYGTVYRGTYDNQDVAVSLQSLILLIVFSEVKVLDWGEDGVATASEIAGLRAAFRQEVTVWQKLDHANVTKFIGASMGTSNLKIPSDAGGQDTVPSKACCVVVEFVHGGTLKQFLLKNRRKKLPYKVVIQLALDLAKGFGICLWEIYCCDMPYLNLSFADASAAVANRNLRPEIPRCCPSVLANIMKRCWDKNPQKRPEMHDVVRMLEAIDTSKGGGMIPDDQTPLCFCFMAGRRGP
ncbi:hypothetical protein TSUD_45980 [Trifolium subterraneum]|nr:hypothetical protein TSUD_45980 [Trifolium subterraneum]